MGDSYVPPKVGKRLLIWNVGNLCYWHRTLLIKTTILKTKQINKECCFESYVNRVIFTESVLISAT